MRFQDQLVLEFFNFIPDSGALKEKMFSFYWEW